MKYEEIISELKKKIYHPVYFLYGKEPYYIDLIGDYISDNTLQPEEQAFNQFIFYGKDSDLQQIIGQAKKFPMMSNYQVIIVREAQMMKGLTAAPTKNKPNPFLLYC
jgi:DNA polymerase III subunit delta